MAQRFGGTQTLAEMIRKKFPGQYDDLFDADLEAKIDAKYPGAYDDVPRTKGGAPRTATGDPEPDADVLLGISGGSYSDVRDQVRHIWQSVLRMDTVDDDTGFFHAGGSSLASVLVVERLAQTFDCEFTVTLLFRYPTVNAMAAYLHRLIRGDNPAADNRNAERDDTRVASQTRTHVAPSGDEFDIAIIGLACRLPNGITELDGFWRVLDAQRDVITEYPETRGRWPRGGGIERGGFLIDGECFDAPFFRMSPSEAEVTDPQQRLLLEASWACFEDACVLPAALQGTNTGVFVGASNTDYAHLLQDSGAEVEAHSAVGNSLAVLANRVSYFYDFHGPSLLIDTACSASLVALHVALQSLRAGECGLALVGGVNFICNPSLSYAYQKAGMLSPDGKCKVFDDAADGYVRSEGAVVLLLKPLRDAIADDNRIHAILKGSAVNHGGQAAGLTVPNPQKQAALLASAWRNARIDPSRISYLEAHGTGTPLGDPLEIEGIQIAFGQVLPASTDVRCGVGSLKSTIGHLESGAGLAGVLKVIAAMAHHRLPGNHVASLNSKMALQGASLHIQTTPQAWNAPQPRLAGVSSFGSGGANAHVVVQEYAAVSANRAAAAAECASSYGNVFVLSSIDDAGVRRNARAVVDWLRSCPSPQHFTDALYTWQCGRTAFKHRLAAHVRDFDELERKLARWLDGDGDAVVCAKLAASARGDGHDVSRWDEAVVRRDWDTLARCWVQGRHGGWSGLYVGLLSVPRFLSAPGYAFSKERHWVSVERADSAPSSPRRDDAETRCLQPSWEGRELAEAVDGRDTADIETHVWSWTGRDLDGPLHAAMPECHVVRLNAVGDTLASRYQTVAGECFARIKALLERKSARKMRIQLVAEDRGDGAWAFGLRGLLKTATLEDPRLDWQIIALPVNTSVDRLQALLRANQCAFESGALIRYTETGRFVRRWEPLPHRADLDTQFRLGAGTAYLITGGLGGLGRLFAKHILTTVPETRVVLTGRSVVDIGADDDLKSWHEASRLQYRPLSLETREEVEALIASLRDDHVPLRGILHCAGQVADNYIVNKKGDEFARVLAPKLNGTLYLDEATRDLDLDFFMLFSSVMSETGNAGQADYACANGFLDQYAAYRNTLVANGKRHGHTVAIDWPLWQHGGMQIDASALALLEETRGMVPMPTAVGLECFRTQIWRGAGQVLILHGDADKISAELNVNTSNHVASIGDAGTPALLASMEQALMTLVGDALKVPPAKRDVHEELTHYGIDSIFVNKINLALSRHFGAISKTLFFQYRTVAEIAAHLVEQHADECRVWTGRQPSSVPPPAVPQAASGVTHASPAVHPATRAEPRSGAIAVIGMSGVLPQASNLDEYWRNLTTGKDCVTEIPRDRWDLDEFYDPDVPRALAQGKSYCKHGAFVDEFAQFDPMFFGISPREAHNIDPHERLFLQEAWRAMEDAGYSSDALRARHRRRVGVFVGVTKTEFELNGAHDPRAAAPWFPHTSFSAIANRLSYVLDLSGPSMPVDTMCSSSLTAIHHACEQIRLGACELAFAGGVNLYLHPSAYYYLCSLRMLSSDGRCRSFGAGGSGFVPGEGAAVVLLKALERAVADGDTVHGVILASQVNHGGRTHGFTVPNPRAQAALIRETLDHAGVDARHLSYIEAHGTGTALGDPIEVDGLQQAFAHDTADTQFCALGSVKSNIGHLEAAAGIAGVVKVLLQMRYRQLVPTLHVDQTNPGIRFASTPFVLNRELRAWPQPVVEGKTQPRMAGVSSFGAGGVNAHLLVQEYEDAHDDAGESAERLSAEHGPVLVPLSARRHEQLVARARQLLNVLNADAQRCDIHRVAYTLQTGRDPMARRAAFVVESVEALRAELEAFLHERPANSTYVAGDREDGGGRAHQPQDVDACVTEHGHVDWHRLAALWVAGARVEWTKLHRGKPTPRRVNLPTYPFAREMYWRGRLGAASAPDDGRSSTTMVQSDERPASSMEATDNADVLLAVPTWRTLRNAPTPETAVFSQRLVLLCNVDISAAALASALNESHTREAAPQGEWRCVSVSASANDIAERYRDIAVTCFEHVRELARDSSSGKTLIQCVIPESDEGQIYRGLSALLRTASMEHSRLVGQVIGIEASLDAETLAARLRRLQGQPGATLAQCERERIRTLDWQPLNVDAERGELVYKDDGVYVITGGLGVLGRLFAKNIVDHCSRATVILTGRSPLTEAIAQEVSRLQRAQSRVVYRQLDLQDAAGVTALFDDIETQYRTVHGVIHCAGRIADSLIVKKSSLEFEATLLPKVTGTWHLDLASRRFGLDFFVVFSSIASAMGSIGQADYAAANGFMDHFIHHRRELVRRGERHGASVSIHWPYWQDGGMRIDAATLEILEQSIGMRPMATEVGLSAFHRAVAMDLPRMLVAQGDPERFLARLRGGGAIPSAPASAAPGGWSLDRIQKTLRDMLADVLHARPEDIELRKPLVELGLDSVLGTEFVSAINRRFSTTLSSVGIYDHPSVMALAHYVEAAQPKPATPVAVVHEPVARYDAPEPRLGREGGSRGPLARPAADDRIAVIGMSGRYPQAKNLDAYWRNLAAGRNAIVEVDDSRWDSAAYYDADPDAEGKMYCKWMGVLDDADAFDPRFFRITPQEALYMDPEQRLFLQEGYRALEDAGYVGDIADGLNCGVYLGMESSEYGWHFANSPRVSETITGNHSAIAASRLAYFLNLKGPALAVDTACSSSLVATHLACQALRGGEVGLALAGGVRLWLSPVTHIGMCKARMLSPTGQCRTFDDTADGIVMGEGVGAVVLKRLRDAERDGDHIYGVILASGINQDGRTNGITAPSVKSQIELERRIYHDHGVDPESISYIEAHGTGTKLGDPIELQALSTVFKERTQRERFCALGSVKTNIGHTAAASGIASLHKVLLCLRHASLVPTLNIENENRHFDFEHSPFYLNREYKPWKPASGKRRAGVSSFGFSGTNAHLVLEEYVPPVRQVGATSTDGERLILLSARNAAQLEQRARDLLDFVEHDPACNSGDAAAVSNFLHALAQTLQVGRAAMEERAAFVAGSLDDLKAGLCTLGGQARDTVGVQRGRCAEDDGILGLWNTDDDLRATAAKWLRERRLSNLLAFWINGVDFDWRELYGDARIARVSLPTYPFAEERFWVDRRQASGHHAAYRVDRLHPLVHRNVSDLGRQAYRTTLSPRAFYLDDHRVNGARVLPGVAYLEMARAAIALALPEEDTHALEFLDHAWAQPLVVDSDVELTIVLRDDGVDPDGGRRIDYEILTEADAGDTLHCRGSVRCHADAPELEVVDLASVEDAIDGAGNDHAGHDRDTLYRRFAALGLLYGPSMQGIVDLRTDGREVLAHLRLPEGEGVGSGDYVLHPSLVDAAMQCTICLLAGFDTDSASVAMPFSFDAMRVHAGTAREMLAWVRPSAEEGSGASGKLDVDLLNTGGVPCVSLRGLVARAIPQASVGGPTPRAVVRSAAVTDAKLAPRPSANTPAKPTLRALLPIWNPVRLGTDTVRPDEGERGLLLGGDETLFEWLRPALADLRQLCLTPDASIEAITTALSASSFDHLFWFAPDVSDTDSIVSGQNSGVLSLFRIIKALTELDHHERELKLTVVTFRTQQVEGSELVSPHHAGVHGMIGSIAKELPLWRIRLLDIESTDDLAAHEILALPWDEKGRGLAHRGGEWFRQEFAEVVRLPQAGPACKHNGTYVVIGGAGGLGEVWTRHMVARYDANVVWIGRRPMDEGIEAKLGAIAAIGRRPHYIAADAADEAALASAIDRVRSLVPRIDGVVHSALVLQDQSVRGMDETVFRQSLVAKVDVSVNLEKVFRGHDLDFMLFFSSVSSFSRGAGQSNYCAGCTFKDSFAHALSVTQPYPVKIVNWGYWGSVGIVADEFYRKRMERLGFGSIEPEGAMEALERFMASEMNQLVLVDVIADAALDELPVSEEIRHYPDSKRSTNPSAMSVAS